MITLVGFESKLPCSFLSCSCSFFSAIKKEEL